MLKRREFLKFSPPTSASADGYWLHVSRTAMACRFEATMPRRDTAAVSVANNALETADRIEQQLTVFRESSEVSYINRSAASNAIRVEPSLWELLIVCQELHRETAGSFDITSAPLSRCWGFLRRQGRIPESNEIEEALAVVGGDKLRFDHQARTIRFERLGVEVNFGSIGKGYALDRMAATMRGRMNSALLSAGSSSLLAIGAGDRRQSGWKVGIRHPARRDPRIAVLRLCDCAMSTSGSEEQFFEHEGKRHGHIIDPRSGQPAEGVASATVIAQSAALTDALATAFYVGGVELAERYCASNPGVMAIILESGYQRYYNPMYQAAYESIIKQGVLGEVYHARLAWHRNSTWRKNEEPPTPDFNPSKWGYPDWEHLLNWRMYRKYSEGLMAELGSHQLTATSWFFDAAPEAVYTAGTVSRFRDGREVFDHIYSTFEYSGGRTATFSSIQSNAFEDAYEMFMGTKGTLILKHEVEAYLFGEGEDAATRVEVSRQTTNPIVDASATRPADSPGRAINSASGNQTDRGAAYRSESSRILRGDQDGRPGALRTGEGDAIGDSLLDGEQGCGAKREIGDCRRVGELALRSPLSH